MISFIKAAVQKLKRIGKEMVATPAQAGLRLYLQKAYIARYGELMDLHVDADKRKISLSVKPKGEETQIEVVVDYRLKESSDGVAVTITKVKTSREWLTLLADDYLVPYTVNNIPKIAKTFL